MKKYFHFVMMGILLFAFGCKKKEKSQSSSWTVHEETFTDVATVSLGKAIANSWK